jgi:hypothetical protein
MHMQSGANKPDRAGPTGLPALHLTVEKAASQPLPGGIPFSLGEICRIFEQVRIAME